MNFCSREPCTPCAESDSGTLSIPSRTFSRCGRVAENDVLTVGCEVNQTIDKIIFASFGTTSGNCTAGFSEGICSETGKIGSCALGKCFCEPSYEGKACERVKECPGQCSGHGVCKFGRCYCVPGFEEPACKPAVNCPSVDVRVYLCLLLSFSSANSSSLTCTFSCRCSVLTMTKLACSR